MNAFSRNDGRQLDALRPIGFEIGVQPHAEGSALIDWGRTRVLCAVSVSDRPPAWLAGQGRGWLTAQYAMLPRATSTRNPRAGYDGRVKGRSQEIQRLIGRSLRAGLDLTALGERLLTVDCDVLVADGGTRCASITGAWLAVRLAVDGLLAAGEISADPLGGPVCAVSAGLVGGEIMLDLSAEEDQRAEADFNFSFLGAERLIEIQGTGEQRAFAWAEVEELHCLAAKAAAEINAKQTAAYKEARS